MDALTWLPTAIVPSSIANARVGCAVFVPVVVLMVMTGTAVSTKNVRLSVAVLPAASLAKTRSVWLPSDSAAAGLNVSVAEAAVTLVGEARHEASPVVVEPSMLQLTATAVGLVPGFESVPVSIGTFELIGLAGTACDTAMIGAVASRTNAVVVNGNELPAASVIVA